MINNNSYKGPLVIVIPNSFITSSESNSKDIKLKIETSDKNRINNKNKNI